MLKFKDVDGPTFRGDKGRVLCGPGLSSLSSLLPQRDGKSLKLFLQGLPFLGPSLDALFPSCSVALEGNLVQLDLATLPIAGSHWTSLISW